LQEHCEKHTAEEEEKKNYSR